MAEFVIAPNLPKRADVVLIGEKYADKLEIPLKKRGILPIFIPSNPLVDPRLASHVDLTIFHAGGKRIYLAPFLQNDDFVICLEDLGAETVLADIRQTPQYPHDAALNIAVIGNSIIYNPKVSYKPAVDFLTISKKYRSIPCKQGYAKCSALVVNERSLITEDRGIAKGAMAAGLDVLEITPGYVSLDGFSHGFIGGAGFKLNSGELAFTGMLDSHPDKQRILDFLSVRNITPVYLTSEPIFDIGSVITLTEK